MVTEVWVGIELRRAFLGAPVDDTEAAKPDATTRASNPGDRIGPSRTLAVSVEVR
jgi:hypothetical protein